MSEKATKHPTNVYFPSLNISRAIKETLKLCMYGTINQIFNLAKK